MMGVGGGVPVMRLQDNNRTGMMACMGASTVRTSRLGPQTAPLLQKKSRVNQSGCDGYHQPVPEIDSALAQV